MARRRNSFGIVRMMAKVMLTRRTRVHPFGGIKILRSYEALFEANKIDVIPHAAGTSVSCECTIIQKSERPRIIDSDASLGYRPAKLSSGQHPGQMPTLNQQSNRNTQDGSVTRVRKREPRASSTPLSMIDGISRSLCNRVRRRQPNAQSVAKNVISLVYVDPAKIKL